MADSLRSKLLILSSYLGDNIHEHVAKRSANVFIINSARLLKDVKAITAGMYGGDDKRPGKVSVKAVSRALGMDYHRLEKMKLCMEEINRYYETQEHYWAREIVWVVKQIRMNNETLNYNRIYKRLNLKRKSIFDSMDELKEMDEEMYGGVREII